MPFAREVRTVAPQLIGVLLPEFLAPFSNRFIRYFDAALEHHFLNIPVAQGKGVIKPDTVADNFALESDAGNT
jgi:DNA-binding LacI/PurR family transcriptional regulator